MQEYQSLLKVRESQLLELQRGVSLVVEGTGVTCEMFQYSIIDYIYNMQRLGGPLDRLVFWHGLEPADIDYVLTVKPVHTRQYPTRCDSRVCSTLSNQSILKG
jgi:hypothetical protein